MLTRREVLAGSVAGLLLGACRRRAGPAPSSPHAAPSESAAASHFVQIVLGGGIDALYAFDPKPPAELAPKIDAPVADHQITTVGELRLGPHVAPLAPWAERMAVLRGVRVYSAAHPPALTQVTACELGRSTLVPQPSLAERIGWHRDGPPLPSIALGHEPFGLTAIGELGQPILERLLALDEPGLRATTAVIDAQLATLDSIRRPPPRIINTRAALRDTRQLLHRLPDLPRPSAPPWSDHPRGREHARALQLALWVLEHDLAKSVRVFFFDWDSHVDNTATQALASEGFFPVLARFFEELGRRPRPGGTLLDRTLVMIGSELGRFPILNAQRGKHHLPEATYALMGPGVRPGLPYGQTDDHMRALPLDPRGRPARGGHYMDLDDLGATVLAAAGLDPRAHGYEGRRLGVLA